MKRFFLIFLLCLIPSLIFGSGVPGDNLGSHQAVMDLDMNQNDIIDGGTIRANQFDGNFSTGVPHIIECKAGENLTKGDVVYRSGVVGNKMEVSKADFDDATKDQALGFAFETANNGQDILVIMNGMLHDLNTTGRAVGNVYLWESGDYTGTLPSSGVVQDIGELVRVHASQGSIYVHVHPVDDYVSAGIGQDVDIRMGDQGGRIIHEDGQDNHLIETTLSSTTFKGVGTNVNSHEVILEADDAGVKEIAKLQVIQGADPYLRLSVTDDNGTPSVVNVIDFHDTVVSFVNDNTVDIGASGANRPKNYYGAGNMIVDSAGTFNEGSNDADFRIESNSYDKMFFIDGGNNEVGIIEGAWTTPAYNGVFNVVSNNLNGNRIYLESYVDGYEGADLYFVASNSSTIGVNKTTQNTKRLGRIIFKGVNSSNNVVEGAEIWVVQDGDAGAKVPTKITFETYSAGAVNTDQLVLNSDGSIDAAGDVNAGTTVYAEVGNFPVLVGHSPIEVKSVVVHKASVTIEQDAGLTTGYTFEASTLTSPTDHIQIMKKTTYYGSQWGRGHDSKGWDSVEANSFTGDGSGLHNLSTAAAGGNLNEEYSYDAGEFTIPSVGGANPFKDEYEITTASYCANELRFSSTTDNSAFIQQAFDNEYDGGNITFKVHYYCDSATVGQIEFNVEVTTATNRRSTKWDNNAFGLFSNHTVAYEVKIATLTISSNKPAANKLYRMRLWVDVSDTTYTAGSIRVLQMVVDYDKN